MESCPCGSGVAFDACCGPLLAGAPARTAEALMRSRYTAYVRGDMAHLEHTLSTAQRADFSAEQARKWSQGSEWLGLTVHRVEKGTETDTEGLVQFTARFRINGEDRDHTEAAKFAREGGNWVFAGVVTEPGQPVRREAPKIGRNDPCPCGSGKKYKKCCGVAA